VWNGHAFLLLPTQTVCANVKAVVALRWPVLVSILPHCGHRRRSELGRTRSRRVANEARSLTMRRGGPQPTLESSSPRNTSLHERLGLRRMRITGSITKAWTFAFLQPPLDCRHFEFNFSRAASASASFWVLQKHPLGLQLRTFLDLGLDLINKSLRFRWPHFEGRTHLAPRLFRFLFLRNVLLPHNLTPGSCG